MKSDVAIVFVINKIDLNEVGIIALEQAHRILPAYDFFSVIPESLDTNSLEIIKKYPSTIIRVDNKFFGSGEAHNMLLESKEFYQLFSSYKYILLHHMDAFIFSDKLADFIKLDLDYIGAPWDKGEPYLGKKYYVGNGGFSLRKVDSFIKHVDELKELHKISGINEDLCIAVLGDTKMNIADIDTARRFSFEMNVKINYIKNGKQLPMGCHAWHDMDPFFWKPYIEKFNYTFPKVILDKDIREFKDYGLTRVKDFDLLKNTIEDFTDGKELVLWGYGYWGRNIFMALLNLEVNISKVIDSNIEGFAADIQIKKPSEIDFSKKKKVFIAIRDNIIDIQKYLESCGYIHGEDYLILDDIKDNLERFN